MSVSLCVAQIWISFELRFCALGVSVSDDLPLFLSVELRLVQFDLSVFRNACSAFLRQAVGVSFEFVAIFSWLYFRPSPCAIFA